MATYGSIPMVVKGKLPMRNCQYGIVSRSAGNAPTLASKSVRAFKVDDFPALGLPTKAMSGSRGIVSVERCAFTTIQRLEGGMDVSYVKILKKV